ncbi:MAG: hypothetical protein WCD70_15710 [Alphaproteobacteria bacterium]
MKLSKYALMIALTGIMTAGAAHAATQGATQSVIANIKFDTPLALTNNSNIQFGTVKAGQSGTYVIDTNNSITASGTGVWLYGTPASGNLSVSGSTTDAVTITTSNYVANGGVTPSAATCKYGTGTATACDSGIPGAAPGTATPLLVGVQVVADGSQAAGSTATPSFTVSVVYN